MDNLENARSSHPIQIGLPVASVPTLKTEAEKLKYLCLNFDPYGQKQNDTITKLLSEFQLNSDIQDPFSITNRLLILLDQAQLNEKTLKH